MLGYGTVLGTFITQMILCLILALVFDLRLGEVVGFWALAGVCILHVNVLNIVAALNARDRD